ncbi:MAG: Asp23/Gls24 family envelope stress response protein [Oscillospiraceae bacterium]
MYNNQPKPEENVGKLKISQEVIETIANQSALEVPGVYALSKNSGNIKDYISKRSITGGVGVNLKDGLAVVDIAIIIRNGFKIEIVSKKVQENIKEAIQTMTGVVVSSVNIIVEGINFSQQNED